MTLRCVCVAGAVVLLLSTVGSVVAASKAKGLPQEVEAALRLGGFALAHAAWSVEDGDILVTLAVVETNSGRNLERFPGDVREVAVKARQHLEAEPDVRQWALVCDGYATRKVPPGPKQDALLLEVVDESSKLDEHLVQCYRKRTKKSAFALLGKPFTAGRPGYDASATIAAVWAGMQEHPQFSGLRKE